MKYPKILGIIAVFAMPLAQADDSDVKWNGYINLVGGMLKDKPVADTTTAKQYPGYLNYENRFTAMQDSLFALQVSKQLDSKLKVTGQLISKGSQDEFKSSVNWAYITYDINDSSSLRFGRLGMPSYYYSDFVDVGLAYHWIKPPIDVYGDSINFEGINYLRHDTIAKTDLTTEVFYGAFDQTLAGTNGSHVTGQGRDLMGASFTVGYSGWLTTRLMYAQSLGITTSDLDFSSQVEAARPILGNTVVDNALTDLHEVLNNSTRYSYYNGTIKADFDNWFVMGEGIIFNGGGILNVHNRRWYTSTGYRAGKILYHLTYSRSEDLVADSTFSNPISGQILTYIEDLSSRNSESWTLGMRIDTTRSTAVKIEAVKFEEFASRPSETTGIGKNALLRVAFNASF